MTEKNEVQDPIIPPDDTSTMLGAKKSKKSRKPIFYIIVALLLFVFLCFSVGGILLAAGVIDYKEVIGQDEEDDNDKDDSEDDSEDGDNDENSDEDADGVTDDDDTSVNDEENSGWKAFSISVTEAFDANATVTFSGKMPADAVAEKNPNLDTLDRGWVQNDEVKLIFNLFYENYNLEYDDLAADVVVNENLGKFSRYISSTDSSINYTNDVTETGTCEGVGTDLSAPCGSGSVYIGKDFVFIECQASFDDIEICDDIMELLEIEYSDPTV
ncbi:MAG: Ribonuclease, Rne/Rng family [candidate division WS6 bacterium GW2011_GWA2_37_6]|uniref:Ribonuclease, Rne/Rng family n=1 Tax=candidate division WS6 bacterium GW2011_GWA2_37_6 TaxID=1619087 RepID=A0A0G0GY07_9BACT|nr:MAG: Ribonuclease, Rne/Rng family [candidate division WS6 bacterium GW2011_GWA2_37_6]